MARKDELVKVGRSGVSTRRGSRIPASFFRHLQPGKRFVVLAGEDRALMYVRAAELETIRKAYREHRQAKQESRS